jgi:DNA-binding LacI/PurR family transcriptional regulator
LNIRDLAKELDISIGTVSRALNGRADVNDDTRRRVLEAAARLGYTPNQSGRSLRRGVTNTVGFIMETDPDAPAPGDNFFVPILEGMQTVLAAHRLDLVVMLYAKSDDEAAHVRRVVARRTIDALVLSQVKRGDPRIPVMMASGLPFLAFGRSGMDQDYAWVDLDFAGMAAMAVDRFVARGHRRIAIVGIASTLNFGYLFIEAYRQQMARHGLTVRETDVARAAATEAGGYQAGERLYSGPDRPTAVLTVNENSAIGLYRYLSERGIMPGRDVALISARETAVCRYLSPTLTAFRHDLRLRGAEMGRTLLAQIPAYKAFVPAMPWQALWPLELVEGESDDVWL